MKSPIKEWAALWRLGHRLHGSAYRKAARKNPDAVADPEEPIDALRKVAKKLGMPFILCGGLAVIAWGVKRFTHDIDIIGVAPEVIPDFAAEAARRGFDVPVPLTIDPLPSGGLSKITIEWRVPGGDTIPADLFVIDSAFIEEATLRAKPAAKGDKVVSIEDLLVFKLVAGREKDSLDALSLCTLHFDRLDKTYVARWAKRLGAIDAWRDLKDEHASGATGWH